MFIQVSDLEGGLKFVNSDHIKFIETSKHDPDHSTIYFGEAMYPPTLEVEESYAELVNEITKDQAPYLVNIGPSKTGIEYFDEDLLNSDDDDSADDDDRYLGLNKTENEENSNDLPF